VPIASGRTWRAELAPAPDQDEAVDAHRDGKHLASGSDDRSVRVWDASSGELLAILDGHEGAVNSVAFTPDSRRVASASDDRTVRVWEPETGEAVSTLRGHGEVGGRLLDLPEMPGRLASLLADFARARPIVVCGGGATVDLIRDWDRLYGIGEEAAHWLVVRALTGLSLNTLRSSCKRQTECRRSRPTGPGR
jgi:hypothetical protein